SEADAARPRIRGTELHRRRVPHAFFQYAEPARHRAARRQARRYPAQPPDFTQRHAARHLRLQHHRRRMADREDAPDVSAREAASITTSSWPAKAGLPRLRLKVEPTRHQGTKMQRTGVFVPWWFKILGCPGQAGA